MLFPIRNLLVCTDLSENSDEVLRNAEVLRKRVNARMDILYVSDLGLQLEWFSDQATNDTFYKSFIGGIGDELMNKIRAQITRTQVEGKAIIKQGPIIQKISECLEETKYDLLIIGHSSHKGIFQQFLGSIARKLLSSVLVPTLVIKRPLEFHKMAGLVSETGTNNWMITSTLDFYRTLKFEKVEFISLWHELPGIIKPEMSLGEFKDELSDDVDSFIRDDEEVTVRVEKAQDLQIASQLAQCLNEDKVNLALMKRNRGKKINKLLLGSETLRLLELDTANLIVMPV